MGRLAISLCAAGLIVLICATTALATHTTGTGPRQDFVTGSARFLDGKVHVNARSGPSGEDPQGWVELHFGEFVDFKGEVTCLTVVANRAMVGGRVVKSGAALSPVGSGFLQQIVDMGEPGDADGSVTLTFGNPLPEAPTVCPPPVEAPVILHRGNYVVHDAVP